ncbi:HNH endonuclease signature motif containing protein [Citromicrobium bathyomarinum]
MLERKHVIRAFRKVEKDGVPEGRESRKWDVLSPEGKRFPPKVIREQAEREAGMEVRVRSGGWPTNDILTALGFQTLPKDEHAVVQIESHLRDIDILDLMSLAKNDERNPPEEIPSPARTTFSRSVYVSTLVKRLAKGRCDLCTEAAPFRVKGAPFFECHHIIHLADQGPDTIANCVALCPNCHRKMHLAPRKSDVERLKQRALQNAAFVQSKQP